MAETLGEPLATPFDGLTRTFPRPEALTGLEKPVEDLLGPLGIIGSRARSIAALAQSLVGGRIRLSPEADPAAEMEKLMALPGLGPWTAHYLALRALGWPDAFPATDYGVRKALGGLGPREATALAESWRPWRGYATINLWNSL